MTKTNPRRKADDAKLIAIGEQLKPLLAEDLTLGAKRARLLRQAERKAPRPKYKTALANAQHKAWLEKFEQACRDVGYDGAHRPWCENVNRLQRAARRALKFRAVSLEGIGVQAAAALVVDYAINESEESETTFYLWRLAAKAGFRAPRWTRTWKTAA